MGVHLPLPIDGCVMQLLTLLGVEVASIHLSHGVRTVSGYASSGVGYFPYEAKQLTTEILAESNVTFANLFAFGGTNNVSASNSTRGCKLLPGDKNWPSSSVWDAFDSLLDGALIKGVPAAAVCYEDWPQYDESKCAEVQASWNDPAWV